MIINFPVIVLVYEKLYIIISYAKIFSRLALIVLYSTAPIRKWAFSLNDNTWSHRNKTRLESCIFKILMWRRQSNIVLTFSVCNVSDTAQLPAAVIYITACITNFSHVCKFGLRPKVRCFFIWRPSINPGQSCTWFSWCEVESKDYTGRILHTASYGVFCYI